MLSIYLIRLSDFFILSFSKVNLNLGEIYSDGKRGNTKTHRLNDGRNYDAEKKEFDLSILVPWVIGSLQRPISGEAVLVLHQQNHCSNFCNSGYSGLIPSLSHMEYSAIFGFKQFIGDYDVCRWC